ncbi:hypothetical protein ABEB36_001913 [Hypothenemus hampei]|uniref:Uncharacterized protein n=1 Tax=Hypothenemus hampei TaxID=57062 RepID=A0ABD1FGT1_HYPHA
MKMSQTVNPVYISVIKINGVPILPPIMTPERRKQMQKYKQQAVRLEQRLAHTRALKKHLEELKNNEVQLQSALTQCDRNQLTKSTTHLTKDLVDVFEYSSSGVRTILPQLENKEKISIGNDNLSSPKPRLIRSNSYTLETPSAILLEHLKNRENDTCDPPKMAGREPSRSPTIEVYQTDISLQQITVNTLESPINDKKEVFFTKSPLEALQPDGELLKVLKDIPDVYANQIMELLKMQHSEQIDRLERYNHMSRSHDLIDFSSPKKNGTTNDSRPSTADTLKRSSTFSLSPSQSLFHSDSDTLASKLSEEIGVLKEKNGYLEGILKHESKNNFFIVNRQEWAASVIGAHIKGYLTRRLLKTDKVQNLIATIKDVIVCALELHQSENIDEKDVELHRRLINQMTAALYSFHEIFFDLPISEQMDIIATDRQRRRDRLRRPQSSRSDLGSTIFSPSPSLTKV